MRHRIPSLAPPAALIGLLVIACLPAPAWGTWRTDGTRILTSNDPAIFGVYNDHAGGHYFTTFRGRRFVAAHLDANADPIGAWPDTGLAADTSMTDWYVGRDAQVHMGHLASDTVTFTGLYFAEDSVWTFNGLHAGRAPTANQSAYEEAEDTSGVRVSDGLGGVFQMRNDYPPPFGRNDYQGPPNVSISHLLSNGTSNSDAFVGYLPGAHWWDLIRDDQNGAYAFSSSSPTRLEIRRAAMTGYTYPGWSAGGLAILDNLDHAVSARLGLAGTQGVVAVWIDASGAWCKFINNRGGGAFAAPTPVPGLLIGDRLWKIDYSAGRVLALFWRAGVLRSLAFDLLGDLLSPDENGQALLDSAQTPGIHLFNAMHGPDGTVLLLWSDTRLGAGAQIRMLRLATDGTPQAGWPLEGRRVISRLTDQRSARCRVEGNSVLFVWAETPRLPSDHPYGGELYATRLDFSGVTLDAGPAPSAPGMRILSHRFLDHGHRLQLALSLHDATPAQVTVLDLQGRRLASAQVRAAADGAARTEFGLPGQPGILFVRLEQGGESMTRKVVLVR